MKKKIYSRPQTWAEKAMGEQLMTTTSIAIGGESHVVIPDPEHGNDIGWSKPTNIWIDKDEDDD